MEKYRFPFGQTIKPCKPSADGPRRIFILGAYPSALHIRWEPPTEFKSIRAIAVDNEPSPFWVGDNEKTLIEDWKVKVGWKLTWGEIHPTGRLNGSSGLWVDENVIKPLGVTRNECWITDCLDMYHCSNGLADRLADTYNPFCAQHGLQKANMPSHPSENKIVEESLANHRERLLNELKICSPDLLITLGNAALRVLREMVSPVSINFPAKKLRADPEYYGNRFNIQISKINKNAEWLPLAHPAAPRKYQEIHSVWKSTICAN